MRGIVYGVLATFLGVSAPAYAAERALDEGQAVGAVLNANTGEIMVASTMAVRAQDPEVRAFATRLVEDHVAANKQLLDYQEQAGLQGKDSKMRGKEFATATRMTDMLWSKDAGAELDQRFLTDAIAHHREELRTFDEVLIPAAQSPKLQTLLMRQREAVMGHLQQGCTLGQRLGADTEPCMLAEPGTR